MPLKKRHGDALFQPLMVQRPGLQHAARLDDQRDAMAAGKSRSPVIDWQPKTVAMDQRRAL